MLKAERVTKEYSTAAGPIRILEDVDLSLAPGEAAAMMGPSGSGKSTLLYMLGALDRPTSGTVSLDGTNVGSLTEAEQAAFRNQRVGFVFQDHALLPQCTVLENVLVPTLVAHGAGQHAERARALLDAVGLTPRLDHRPAQLSGGERQRVAIARALILQPSLVLCDEPTGNLDRQAAATVADLLVSLHRQQKSILVVVTHSAELASRFNARFELKDRGLVRV
jgi:lipoprotein-releasing system ATP-binding protein